MRRHKAAINKLLLQQTGGVLERSKCGRPCAEEEPSTYHVVSRLKRARTNTIERLHGEGGVVYDNQDAIQGHIHAHFEGLLARGHEAPDGSSPFLEGIEEVVTAEDNADLLAPITKDEVYAALRRSPRGKSPGDDGLSTDFWRAVWEVVGDDMLEVFNHMLVHRVTAPSHIRGVMVMVPKVTSPREIGNLRPVTLLNADAKIYSRVLTGRLAVIEPRLLHPMQARAGTGRNMYEELTDIRDAIGYLDMSSRQCRRRRRIKYQACLVSMDFAGAFNNVSHAFMWEVLRRRGVSEEFIEVLKSLYKAASTRIRVNGILTLPLLLLRGIRQGCPASMLLFNIIMAPLLKLLDERLKGLELPRVQDTHQVAARFATSSYVDDALAVLTEAREADVLVTPWKSSATSRD